MSNKAMTMYPHVLMIMNPPLRSWLDRKQQDQLVEAP
jgi:hypothetical protein